MKSFCVNGHHWHAEFTQALCPTCRQPAIGVGSMLEQGAQMKRLEETIRYVIAGVERSVVIHGDWEGYGLGRMTWVIMCEVWEVICALVKADIYGEHGVISELRDLAVVCVKAICILGSYRDGRGKA